jgi:monofunctional biosynthetic peptidoglycan transglycosylase
MSIAVISSEDQKFADHRGFDFQSIARAIEYNKTSKIKHGASTLSQQVAKNLFLWPGRSYLRKGLEFVLTVLIESLWSKKRILEMYLNIVEFGDGIFGVGAASKLFFKKPPSELTVQEAALLCAVLPNPILYRVNNPSDAVIERQKWIIEQYHNLKSDSKIREIIFPKKNNSITIFL